MKKSELTHALHDPAHCLAPGLFRSLKRGERKKTKLDVAYDYGDGQRIEFSGPEPLGADDLRILQGLIAMAGAGGLVLSPEPKTEGGHRLRLSLDPKWEAVQKDALVAKGSYGALARAIGYANPNDTKTIRNCIERLWKVSIIAQEGKQREGYRLLSEYASNEASGSLHVALNPRITEAILRKRAYARIDLEEVRGLRGDPARLLHQRLCGWIDPGKSGRIGIHALVKYVWPDEAVRGSSAERMRRKRVREALAEIMTIGWSVNEYVFSKFSISRPTAGNKLIR